MKETKLICGFYGVGKTYAANHLNAMGYQALDVNVSDYSLTHRKYTEEELEEIRIEWDKKPHLLSGKGYVSRIRDKKICVENKDYPNNCVEFIKEQLGRVDYILLPLHFQLLEALSEQKIPYTLAYPPHEQKAEYVGRLFIRDCDKDLKTLSLHCKTLSQNWEKLMEKMEKMEGEKLVVEHYLLDTIKNQPY